MDSTIISVIVPVYKVEQYLDRCISSILQQTFEKFEVILVDDGSPDRCPLMCDEWAKRDERVKVIHKKNGGLSSARNAGIDIAKGRYINFVDSDDWMEKDALSYLYELRNRFDADFSMASFTRESRDKKTMESDVVEQCLSGEAYIKKLCKIGTQEQVQYAWGKLYKKKLFENTRYPEGLTAEDHPVALCVASLSEKIAISNKVIYHYTINSDGITRSRFSERAFDMLHVGDIMCEYADKCCSMEVQKMVRLNRMRTDFAMLYTFAVADLSVDEKRKYKPSIARLQQLLRNHTFVLLRAPIPISRKLVILAFDISYPITAKILRMIIRLKK